MNTHEPVLVVGTTPDYVEWIRRERPGKTLFLTDPDIRAAAREPSPDPDEEVCCSLIDAETVFGLLMEHCSVYDLEVAAMACFDCENMLLAAALAERLGIHYPSETAVHNCRNKLTAKRLWLAAQVPCPKYQVARTADDAEAFVSQLGAPCVAKPLSGAGSELTFLCNHAMQARERFEQVLAGLVERQDLPMFRQIPNGASSVLMEEWIDGIEYSCDFIVERDHVIIVRMARKYHMTGGPFGITVAYELIDGTGPFNEGQLKHYLGRAVAALGLDRSFCMVDLIDRGGLPIFLEISPRPGGDCLPWLLRKASGVDVLGLYLDFARGCSGTPRINAAGHVALRLFADCSGVLKDIDTTRLAADRRVREIALKRCPGDPIQLPPVDYDSWLLGHVVYVPDQGLSIAEQNDHLASLVTITGELTGA